MKIERPIYRIETESLVLRPWREDEVDVISSLILANLEHLRRWLPWANHEPEPRREKLERIRCAELDFSQGVRCAYGIYDATHEQLLGCVALEQANELGGRFHDPDRAAEIGYWLAESSCGLGIMTVCVAAITRAAVETMGLAHLEIHCDPVNTASARIPERLGYRHMTTHKKNTLNPSGELRDTMIWVMDEVGYKNSPASGLPLTS